MKRLVGWLRRFFFPPADAPRWVKALPYTVMGILTIALLTFVVYAWDYTNSPQFCGTTCHTMPPEYNAYLVSPHARIACVECHIGRGFVGTQFTRKAGDLRHVIYTITKNYEFPITADDMRPARETCEKCHSPEKFSDDSLREIKHFGDDAQNVPVSIYLILKTGGGSKRQGLGKGIHWHIENRVLFYPTDKQEQSIPYIRVYNDDGTIDEYTDLQSNVTPANISESSLKEMDCITCHNRITHIVPQPEASVDQALTQQLIDQSIPEIRKKGVETLRGTYTAEAQALNAIAGLANFYQGQYPDYAKSNGTAIENAVKVIQEIYTQSVFLEQKSDWNSHPNNVGHKDSSGCFRCHDGKHVNAKGEAIRLECNLCHSIPVVAGAQKLVTNIEIIRGTEPQTHRSSTWIAQHNKAIDKTCSNCHTTANPGGVDNTSFCSNSACHGNVWKYAGFDAPKLRELVQAQLPPTPTPEPTKEGGEALTYNGKIGTIFQATCGGCHGEGGTQGLNLTTYQGAMAGSQNGPVIVPGNADGSLLVQKQSGDQPHYGQLTPEELELIKQWINAGAPEE